jgi:malate dehydrogenase (oxaloacetate-decarboxylating)
MLNRWMKDESGDDVVDVALSGASLLEDPLLNKGSGFPADERRLFNLEGLLPPHISTWEEQLLRTYGNFTAKSADIDRHVFLTSLQDRNETLFYGLIQTHIREMMPIIYTPVVGEACRHYSRMYRRPRGLYLSYPDRDRMDTMLANVPHAEVEVIVVTDGERILGLGDLGMNGMGIPIGKLSLYTLCAGIHPAVTLPIVLDVGTNNQELLGDPLYLGWRHERVRGAEYDAFIERFVSAVKKRWPLVLLQWEDFAKGNAARLLEKYQNQLCTFNDDIQGTGAVSAAGVMAAVRALGGKMLDQRVVILGAGSAAMGIGDQIVMAMLQEGGDGAAALAAARSKIWLVDSQGLVSLDRENLEPGKKRFAQFPSRMADWTVANRGRIDFAETVRYACPTILIGTSAQPGVFTKEIVLEMERHSPRPIIFPLSNPTSKCEATPEDLLAWTEGRALVATGSPYSPVTVGNKIRVIGQCNNAYIFPGMGLGVTASGARRVTDEMFFAAARTLADLSPAIQDPDASLFPDLSTIRDVSYQVALSVAQMAQSQGHADPLPIKELERRVRAKTWIPRYARYRLGAGEGMDTHTV